MVAGLSLFFSKKIEQPPHLTQYFSLFKIDFSQEFYVSGKSCGKCEICLSSQLTRHAPPFSGYGLMIRDAYVRKKESRICSTKSASEPQGLCLFPFTWLGDTCKRRGAHGRRGTSYLES